MPKGQRHLPTLDYVSIVASLYKDRRAMLVGMAATISGVMMAALKTDAPVLYAVALAFVVSTAKRYYNMLAFEDHPPAPDDRAGARAWERRQMIQGTISASIYGCWCFVTLVFVRDPFAELVAISVTIAAMIGIVTRNFGVDRIVTSQSLAISIPLALGLALVGDGYHLALAALLVPLMVSFRFLAADVRGMLLSQVHERTVASRLASQLDTALETMQHGLCMLDENGVIALANDRAQQTFAGIAEGSWVGRSFADLLEEAIGKRALPETTADRLNRMIIQQTGGKIVMKLSGDFHCEVTVSSRGDRTVLLFENVTARIRAQERINFMARYDGLTGLPNRAYFTEQVQAELASRQRTSRREPVFLAIIDIDDFKHVNDTLGHLAGDRVLSETAVRIQTVMHRDSRLARLGGDEFVIYRARNTDSDGMQAEVEAILSILRRPFEVGGERADIDASIGFVSSSDHPIGLDDLITRADLALYRAKARGKGQYQAFVEEMDSEFRYRQRLKNDLAIAISEDQLKLVYQPLVDPATRRVVGCEALARWTHPELGPIAPDVFIGLAEETGQISAITRWVLQTATAECVFWPQPISVAVNVSARDLRGEDLTRYVSEALKASGLAPGRLEIEVTETALIEDREGAAAKLAALADKGIGIALDDFGTGYSSLSYLRGMAFSKLKIDRSFIADITTSDRSLKLMANVARLGQDLDLVLVAEGVETEDQLEAIARHTAIDQVQGFLFGTPLPAPETRELIARMNRRDARSRTAKRRRPALVSK
ncbi:putative bifunctional diguanylate cyclase/phosphodiesterase [Pelagibacterium halotolerans]|uniref:Sensory box/GGDEF family protein n=1 Tax=Pelagibacterium halotolerans (strain DSM 22347 / JCM 15775 / CGMCC 1.7692 / B2) TaxID=1082931 RepID=G4R6V5_PELHB|nr:EAL domain-containing protein [Pelagibacterium halotolerans]AEQ53228.1 sensory box/GGDEF family protein [Pelagibacterium halotolerans B2]QJR17140.1 EAL domain-containing protein [Pelagibacterium halotolerans]